MAKTLIAITTYNQSKYTKIFYESFLKLDTNLYDLIVIDDASTDDTVSWCKENSIEIITKPEGKGLTDSWNRAYKYFKNNSIYDQFVIANNDILIPIGALDEMVSTLKRWPGNLVVPLSTAEGCGHNKIQAIGVHYGGDRSEYSECQNYQSIQNTLLEYKKKLATDEGNNNLYQLDPVRMKMFNGFFFMMGRGICQYEREDGNLFRPEYINTKNEDIFNWDNLLNNDDNAILCKTSFVFHFKGVSTFKIIEDYKKKSNDKNWIDNRI